jgi:tetratricopeptide (TPR) repeat protein
MRNVKPIYIYGIGVIISALVFIFIAQPDADDLTKKPEYTNSKQIPKDNFHHDTTSSEQPSAKDSVTESVKQRLAEFKKNADANSNDTLKLREYADFLAAAHQQDEAVVYYNKILKINPKRVDILFAIANINYMNQNFSVAEKYLDKVISYDKNNVQAYYNLGVVAAGKGDKAKAKEIWSKIIKEYPKAQLTELAKKSMNEM